jgi:hypothetical protein
VPSPHSDRRGAFRAEFRLAAAPAVEELPAGRHAEKERLSANAYTARSGPNARLAQWESITLTLWGSQVQSLHRASLEKPVTTGFFYG